MSKVNETLDEIRPKHKNSKGEDIPNRFSKKNFTNLMKAMANDPSFSIKVPVIKEGKKDHIENIMVTEGFRKWCKKLLEKAGFDKKESAMVLDSSFEIDTMDGLYEFFATALYEYMKAGNRFDLIPREDFKGSLSVVKKPKDKKVRDSRDPKTGKSLGTFEYTNESYHSVVASSPCPSYLKGRKKIK